MTPFYVSGRAPILARKNAPQDYAVEHRFKSHRRDGGALFADLPECHSKTLWRLRAGATGGQLSIDPILPKFADDEIEELRRQSNEGLQARLAKSFPMPLSVEEYQKRLDFRTGDY